MAYGSGWKKRLNLNHGVTDPTQKRFGIFDHDGPRLTSHDVIEDEIAFGSALEKDEDEGSLTGDIGEMLLRYAYSRLNPLD
tara:strand:+ start:1245 stop:1487 length:243 start_codon:yes stop_codon:yes gene_type:complete